MARIKLPSPCVCVYFFAERLLVGGDLDFLPGDENLSLSASFFGDFAGDFFGGDFGDLDGAGLFARRDRVAASEGPADLAALPALPFFFFMKKTAAATSSNAVTAAPITMGSVGDIAMIEREKKSEWDGRALAFIIAKTRRVGPLFTAPCQQPK